MRGTITARSVQRLGITESVVSKAKRANIVMPGSIKGFLKINPRLAEKKQKMLENELEAGEQVYRMVDGAPRKLQVVKSDNGQATLIDPETEEVGDSREEELFPEKEFEDVTN